MTSTRSARRAIMLTALLFAGNSASSVAAVPSAAPTATTASVTSMVDAPAGAPVAARRMSFDDRAVFPMQPTPRCDILDNFGDPRSGGRHHEGSDMLATLGQQVYAASDGTLTLQVVAGSSSPGANLSGNPGAGNYHLHFEIHPGGGAAVDPLPLLVIPRECTVS